MVTRRQTIFGALGTAAALTAVANLSPQALAADNIDEMPRKKSEAGASSFRACARASCLRPPTGR